MQIFVEIMKQLVFALTLSLYVACQRSNPEHSDLKPPPIIVVATQDLENLGISVVDLGNFGGDRGAKRITLNELKGDEVEAAKNISNFTKTHHLVEICAKCPAPCALVLPVAQKYG